MRVLAPDDVVFEHHVVAGGLGYKLDPVRRSSQPVGHMRCREGRLIYDNCIENTGALLVTACSAAPDTTCLLLGDSYGRHLAKYLSEGFRRLVFAHAPTMDPQLLDAVQPNLFITAIAERF